jgi:hypothetical protein
MTSLSKHRLVTWFASIRTPRVSWCGEPCEAIHRTRIQSFLFRNRLQNSSKSQTTQPRSECCIILRQSGATAACRRWRQRSSLACRAQSVLIVAYTISLSSKTDSGNSTQNHDNTHQANSRFVVAERVFVESENDSESDSGPPKASQQTTEPWAHRAVS